MQGQLKLVWWCQDSAIWYTWRHIDTVSRPTEDAAFTNIETSARRHRNAKGRTQLTYFEYQVWQAERRVLSKPRPQYEQADIIAEVARVMHHDTITIQRVLGTVERIFQYRDDIGLTAELERPPKPRQRWRQASGA